MKWQRRSRHPHRDERNLTMKERIELRERDVKRRWLGAATMTILLGGCMVGPDYQRPPVTTPDVFRGSPTPTPDAQSIADLKWFEVFSDEQLQELIRTALVQNYDLRDAVARVDAARANLGITQADQYPNFGVGADGFRSNELSRQGQFTIPSGTRRQRRSAQSSSIFLPLRSTSGAGCAGQRKPRAPNCWLRIGTEKP